MPCNSEYMKPSQAEANSKMMAKLLMFIRENGYDIALSEGLTLEHVTDAAEDYYGSPRRLAQLIKSLCLTCQNLPEDFIYNGKVRMCRDLANWWDDHKEADKETGGFTAPR